MVKKLRFYTALMSAFARRDKRKLTFGAIAILLVVFLSKVLLPPFVPIIGDMYVQLRKPTFVEGAVGAPAHPNPLFDSTETQRDISRLIFRGLTKVDAKGTLVMDLAKDFEKISDEEYIFTLREDVFWHDGKKFSADDVVYTVQTAQDPKNESEAADNFKDVTIEKINDYTIKFKLKEAFTPFPSATAVGIIPEHIPLKKYKPIGTGPFKVKSITKDKIVLVSKNLNLVFKFYMRLDDAKIALKLGEIHALGGFTPQEVDALKKFGGRKIYQHTLPFRQAIVFFNTRAGHLKSKDVRQALSYALDKGVLRRLAGGSEAVVSTNQLPLNNWVDSLGEERYPFNLKEAKKSLENADYELKNGNWQRRGEKLSVTITTVPDPELSSIANILKEAWIKLGIEVEIRSVDIETLRTEITSNRDFQVLVDFQTVAPDPDQYVLWHTTQTRKANITGIRSPKLDKLLEDARKVDDKTKRAEQYKLFTKLLLDEAPAIFLYYPQYIWVVSEKVSGVSLKDFATPSDRFNSYQNWKIKKKFL